MGRFASLSVIVLGICATLAGAQTLKVSGDITSPLVLTSDELAKLPHETIEAAGVKYEGVLLREILKRVGAPFGEELKGKALTTYVVAKAHDGYQVVFTLAEVDPTYAGELILVAEKRDGKPLPENQGPFRLVCPNDKAGARSVRMLEALKVVRLLK